MHAPYPIFLKLNGIPCVVIGGGKVAERKITTLLESGAGVIVISPEVTGKIQELAVNKKITLLQREYAAGDLDNAFLAVAATDSSEINKAVYNEAIKNKILINTVDDPDLCNFHVPSKMNRGALQIAVSTSGKAPYLSKKIREHIDKKFPENTGNIVDKITELREMVLNSTNNDNEKKTKLKETLNNIIDDFLKNIQ